MKKKLLYILAIVGGLSLTSCSDMLETENLSSDNAEYLLGNPTDARKMLNHVYSYFCEDTYTSRMSTNWMQNTDVEVGLVNASQAQGSDRRGIWAINPRQFSDIKNCWDNSLKAIDFANQCIAGIQESSMYKDGDKDMKQLLGEAYCLRAYWYWLMCNFWGDVPFAVTPTTKDEMHNDPRTDKNIIYSHCIQDLIDHEAEMQWATETTVEWMNRDFALGMIVRLSMFRAGYSMQEDGTMARCDKNTEEYQVKYVDENGVEQIAQTSDDYYKVAVAYAQKLIKAGKHTLGADFKKIFDNEINNCNPANGDVLYEVAFVPNSGGDIGWCHGLSVVGGSHGAGTTYTNLMPNVASSFAPSDQRLAATCANYRWEADNKQSAQDGAGVQPAKWCRNDLSVTNVESKGTGINWPVMRYADVLLLAAEAMNEMNGPTAEAKALLKQVRDRAFINAADKEAQTTDYVNALTTKESFREAIMQERVWEFAGENLRKFDLVRWNNYADKVCKAIEEIINIEMNYQRLTYVGGEFLYDKNREIEDLGIAPRLYYYYKEGKVEFENDYRTYRSRDENLYKNAETVDVAEQLKEPGITLDGLKYVTFYDKFMSVSDTDPSTKKPYGEKEVTDEDGNIVYESDGVTPKKEVIKKGQIAESLYNSWWGITKGELKGTSTDGGKTVVLSRELHNAVAPYVIPIPTERVSSSGGILNNNGYGILNK